MEAKSPHLMNAKPNEPQPTPKQPWHKPTLVYVPLQVTAAGSGTQDDANGSSTGS